MCFNSLASDCLKSGMENSSVCSSFIQPLQYFCGYWNLFNCTRYENSTNIVIPCILSLHKICKSYLYTFRPAVTFYKCISIIISLNCPSSMIHIVCLCDRPLRLFCLVVLATGLFYQPEKMVSRKLDIYFIWYMLFQKKHKMTSPI